MKRLTNWFIQRNLLNPIKRTFPSIYKLISPSFTTTSTTSSTNNFNINNPSLEQIAFPSSSSNITNNIPEYTTIDYKVDTTNKIATITLNRPKQLNAFNLTMWNEFKHIFNTTINTNNKDIRVVILTGSTKSFSTGMDLSVFMDIDVVVRHNLYDIVCMYIWL